LPSSGNLNYNQQDTGSGEPTKMTSMKGDVINRVRRFPKPTRSAQALQPLFEAVSNAKHAVEDRFGATAVEAGRITITITNIKDPQKITIIVDDNGIGLDDRRYEAFATTDTDFKISRGGKGVGRLLWLDAFQRTSITSTYEQNGRVQRRSFSFELHATDQLTNEVIITPPGQSPLGTIVNFGGLRGVAYQTKFPSQAAVLVKHFGSHFFADFILGQAPQITLSIDGTTHVYPESILALRVEDRGTTTIPSEEFGDLALASFVCKRAASADFDGLHQLHYIANGRTVTTRKIDGLIGIGRFGEADDLVYHGCISGEFLNERVNQERTQFTFDESVADDIAKKSAEIIRTKVLNKEIGEFDGERLDTMQSFVTEYPSFHFDTPEALLARTPKNAVKAEQFAQALIPIRIRRDNERRTQVQAVVAQLGGGSPLPDDFAEAVRKAANEVRAEEQRQLTEYVLRRKMVLDVLEVLIRRVRERESGPDDHHLESTLHQFICPMKVRGDDPDKIEGTDHDLWIIDERLALSRYFASDVPFSQIVTESKNIERPDLFIFDHLHSLGFDGDEPLRRVMLVEFKKPGRKDYDERYTPMTQVSKYLSELVGGKVENYNRERVRIAEDCIFYCYVVADIVGALDVHTSSWRTTSNGRGRWIELSGKYRGSIEVIEWKDLLTDARARNQGFIQAAGV
jgi:hypothetical protein